MHDASTFTLVLSGFVAGWGLRALLGALCIKGHLTRIEQKLGVSAGSPPSAKPGPTPRRPSPDPFRIRTL